jgi:hypothetical protein
MWSAIATIAASVLGIISKMMGGGRDKADAKQAGALEAANTSLQTGVDTIKAANEAAKETQNTPEAIANDPDNLDRRR